VLPSRLCRRWGSRSGWGRELPTNGSDARRAPPRRRAQPLRRSRANHGAGERAGPSACVYLVGVWRGGIGGGGVKRTNERRRRGRRYIDNEIIIISIMRARFSPIFATAAAVRRRALRTYIVVPGESGGTGECVRYLNVIWWYSS